MSSTALAKSGSCLAEPMNLLLDVHTAHVPLTPAAIMNATGNSRKEPSVNKALPGARAITANLPNRNRGVGLELAASLEASWSDYCRRLKICRRRMSEEGVHQLRVSTRRLVSAVTLLEVVGAVRRKDATDVQRVLKKRLKALGAIRDTHVLRMAIEEKLLLFPELVLLKRKLVKRERKLLKSAAPAVKGWGTAKLEKHMKIMRRNLVHAAGSLRGDQSLSRASLNAITHAFKNVVVCRQAIKSQDAETVHRTRLAFKRFRYMVELLSPCVTGFTPKRLGDIARYQKRMGQIQDYEVLQAYVENHIRKHQTSASALSRRFLAYLRRRRIRLLRDFLAKADDLYAFWQTERA